MPRRKAPLALWETSGAKIHHRRRGQYAVRVTLRAYSPLIRGGDESAMVLFLGAAFRIKSCESALQRFSQSPKGRSRQMYERQLLP